MSRTFLQYLYLKVWNLHFIVVSFYTTMKTLRYLWNVIMYSSMSHLSERKQTHMQSIHSWFTCLVSMKVTEQEIEINWKNQTWNATIKCWLLSYMNSVLIIMHTMTRVVLSMECVVSCFRVNYLYLRHSARHILPQQTATVITNCQGSSVSCKHFSNLPLLKTEPKLFKCLTFKPQVLNHFQAATPFCRSKVNNDSDTF